MTAKSQRVILLNDWDDVQSEFKWDMGKDDIFHSTYWEVCPAGAGKTLAAEDKTFHENMPVAVGKRHLYKRFFWANFEMWDINIIGAATPRESGDIDWFFANSPSIGNKTKSIMYGIDFYNRISNYPDVVINLNSAPGVSASAD